MAARVAPTEPSAFDASAWASSLLFSQPGGVQPRGAGSQVGKHLPGHWLKRLIRRCRFKHSTDVAKV